MRVDQQHQESAFSSCVAARLWRRSHLRRASFLPWIRAFSLIYSRVPQALIPVPQPPTGTLHDPLALMNERVRGFVYVVSESSRDGPSHHARREVHLRKRMRWRSVSSSFSLVLPARSREELHRLSHTVMHAFNDDSSMVFIAKQGERHFCSSFGTVPSLLLPFFAWPKRTVLYEYIQYKTCANQAEHATEYDMRQ